MGVRTVIVAWLVLIGSAGMAQSFTVKFQFVPPDIGRQTFDFGASLEGLWQPLGAWTLGARVALNLPTDGALSTRLQVYALHLWRLYGDGQLSFSGYLGGEIGAYYSPFIEPNDDPPPYIDADPVDGLAPAPLARAPIGTFTPTQPLEVNAFALTGVDAAAFINDQWSIYAGVEVNGVVLPQLDIGVFPYLELDWQIAPQWLLVLGGYGAVGLRSIALNLYLAGFYVIDDAVTLRGDIGWNGVVYGLLRLIVRF